MKLIENPEGLLNEKNEENKNENEKIKIKIQFATKILVSKDTYIFRFLLPDENSTLGINTCQYINLESNESDTETKIKKPYQIISAYDDKGFVDILVKVYNKDKIEASKKDYGYFSNYLYNLQVI